MWNRFFKSSTPAVPTVSEAVSHTLTPQIAMTDLVPQQSVQLLTPRTVLLKKLKWIAHRGRIGIVWELDSSGYATIHLTDAGGQTIEVDRVNATELRLAKYVEIPAPRRAGLSQVYAATLGYF